MDNEITAVITIGDEEYTLLLTTKGTKRNVESEKDSKNAQVG